MQSWALAAAPFLQCLGRLSLPPSMGRYNDYWWMPGIKSGESPLSGGR